MLLTALPATARRFVRWSGGCSGRDAVCDPTVAPTTSVTAEFGVAQQRVSISVVGKGQRHLRDAARHVPARVLAGRRARRGRHARARAVRGYTFSGWSGACRGRDATRTITIREADLATRARFRKR